MRRIHLSSGKNVQVSDEDHSWLSAITWYQDGRYARAMIRESGRRYRIVLHRVVMERILGRRLKAIEEVDHIDRNPLNCVRSNLRIATHGQNSMNKAPWGSTGYNGVYPRGSRFESKIRFDGKLIPIGTFSDIDEAAWMRDQWSIALQEEFASLNFDYI